MIVEQTETRVLVVPCVERNGVITKKITLLPGCNDVDADDWAKARDNLKDKIDRGLVKEHHAEIEEVPVAPNSKAKKSKVKSSKNITDLEPADAEKIVKETFNLETLEKWKDEEGRESIRKAILNQIESVEKHGEDKDAVKKGSKKKGSKKKGSKKKGKGNK